MKKEKKNREVKELKVGLSSWILAQPGTGRTSCFAIDRSSDRKVFIPCASMMTLERGWRCFDRKVSLGRGRRNYCRIEQDRPCRETHARNGRWNSRTETNGCRDRSLRIVSSLADQWERDRLTRYKDKFLSSVPFFSSLAVRSMFHLLLVNF